MSPKKRLGRGLDALLSKPVAETAAITGVSSSGGLRQILERVLAHVDTRLILAALQQLDRNLA